MWNIFYYFYKKKECRMKRQIRSLEECRVELGEVQTRIARVINDSVEHWSKIESFSAEHVGYTDFKLASQLGIEFPNDGNIKIGTFNGVFGFLYKDLFFIRFKKLNAKNFSTSNIITQQTLRYKYQQAEIEGLSNHPTILYAGYTLDQYDYNLQGIYFVCRDGENIQWIDQIGTYGFEQTSFAFSNIKDDEKEIERVVKSRVKAKNIKRKIGKTGV